MIIFYILVIIFLVYLLYRNHIVYVEIGELLDMALYSTKREIRKGNYDADYFERLPSYFVMLIKFWKPVDSFVDKDEYFKSLKGDK